MQLLLNEAIYKKVVVELLPQTQKFLWIVTADIKDLHVPKGRRFVPLLEILSDLVENGVSVRLMHAKELGPRFREDFDKYPNLVASDLFERILCPRIHTKVIIIDGQQAFRSPSLKEWLTRSQSQETATTTQASTEVGASKPCCLPQFPSSPMTNSTVSRMVIWRLPPSWRRRSIRAQNLTKRGNSMASCLVIADSTL